MAGNDSDDWLTTAEAAAYLRVSVPTIKKHVYNTKRLIGTLKGHTLLFRRAELDRFRDTPSKQGRPRKSP